MKLSIITICYNSENCIKKTIMSILNQTLPVYEYIVIDGNSQDNTYTYVQSFDEKFQERNIRYIHISEKDKGISDAFNKGISLSTGNLIGIINADDELLPDTCKVLAETYSKVNAGVYYGNCIWVDEENHRKYVSRPTRKLDKLLYYMVLIHPSTFVKKEVYNANGVFDISYKYCMDKELLYRIYKAGVKFHYINYELTKFKAGGVSDKHAVAVFKEGSRMALSYGEPKYKVKVIEYKKRIRNFVIRKLKKMPFYLKLKELKH